VTRFAINQCSMLQITPSSTLANPRPRVPLTWSRDSLDDAPSTGLMSEAIDSERRSPREGTMEVETVETGARPIAAAVGWIAEEEAVGGAGRVAAASSVDDGEAAERRTESPRRAREGGRREPSRAEPAACRESIEKILGFFFSKVILYKRNLSLSI